MLKDEELTKNIIGAAIDVHKAIGPGLLESAYEQCLCHELSLRNLSFKRQVDLPLRYKEVNLQCGYRVDLIVEGSVILELKSVAKLMEIDRAQLLTYMRLSKISIGLLINFNVPVLREGLVRLIL